MNPFNVKSFEQWEDLGNPNQVYLLCFNEDPLGLYIFSDYPYHLVKELNYMMYHTWIYEIEYQDPLPK